MNSELLNNLNQLQWPGAFAASAIALAVAWIFTTAFREMNK